MRKKTMNAVAVIAVLIATAVTVSAHHSFSAEFDGSKTVTIEGKVFKMDFVNPHILLHFDVKKGEEVESWVGTTSSPNAMRRYGWGPASAKAGDKIEITGFLDREGRKIIQMAVNIVNGKTLAVSTTAEKQLIEYKERNPDKPFKNYN